MRVAAIVVLYHPKRDTLERLLRSITDQVAIIFVVDNTAEPTEESVELIRRFEPQAHYLPMGDNRGIASAQNTGIRAAIDADCSHVLLLDQDSVLPVGMVNRLRSGEEQLLRKHRQVAAVGPQFWDEKTGKAYPAVQLGYFRIRKIYLNKESTEPVETDYLIASGSMLRISVLREVGLMREDLFIDWVDVEWGLRARSMGFRSYHIPDALMTHNVGDAVVSILGRDVHVHSDIRNYYMLRNALYLFRLKSMGWRWRITFAPRIPCYLLIYPFLSGNRRDNLRMIWRALIDGVSGRLGPIQQRAENSRG
jgi:rhamnosyltransferase